MEIKDLAQRVREECADLYFTAQHYKIKPFGNISTVESVVLFESCAPWKRYSKWNLFLPAELRRVIREPSETNASLCHNLFIFHYPASLSKIKSKAESSSDFYRQHDPEYNPDKFIERCNARFNGGSCIYFWWGGIGKRTNTQIPLFLGGRRIMEDVMGVVKSSPQGMFGLLEMAVEGVYTTEMDIYKVPLTDDIAFVRKNTNGIHIYDLLNKPKEVHLSAAR